jgi:DNA-binding transcriptional LysR family regulator
MFNWADVRFFLELARQQHLSAAASRLRVDVSTVSRRVAELERVLKCKLFERRVDGFFLSDEGQRLLPYAEKMEASATDIAVNLSGETRTEMSVVRVATMEALAALVIAPQFALLQPIRPDIALEILVVSQPTNLGKREADISFSMMKLDAPRLLSEKIGQFEIGLYGSAEYLAETGVPKTSADLAHHRFVDYLEAFIAIAEVRWLRELAPAAKVVLQSTSLLAQQQAAIGGVGLAALPRYAALNTGLQRVLPDKAIIRELWMTVHVDTEYLSRIRAVSNFLRNRLPPLL